MRLCANLSMMFNEVPFLDRFEAAAKAGFKGVEYLFPYDHPAGDIRSRLDGNGLQQVLFNMPPGDWAAGERGTASLPGRTQEFQDGVMRALDYAGALGCTMVHCMAGIPPADIPATTSWGRYAANLGWAAERMAAQDVRLLLEPINHRDMPGFLLNTTAQGAAMVEALGRDRAGLQFDIYHCQVSEGDITKRAEALMPVIAHMQLADVPARNEPGSGEINWAYVLGRIEQLGYTGWMGCEYRPAGDTVAGLAWREMPGLPGSKTE